MHSRAFGTHGELPPAGDTVVSYDYKSKSVIAAQGQTHRAFAA